MSLRTLPKLSPDWANGISTAARTHDGVNTKVNAPTRLRAQTTGPSVYSAHDPQIVQLNPRSGRYRAGREIESSAVHVLRNFAWQAQMRGAEAPEIHPASHTRRQLRRAVFTVCPLRFPTANDGRLFPEHSHPHSEKQ